MMKTYADWSPGISKAAAERILTAALDSVIEAVSRGDRVTSSILGAFFLLSAIVGIDHIQRSLIRFSPRERYSLYQMAQRPFGRGPQSRSPAQRSLRDLRAAWRPRRLPP